MQAGKGIHAKEKPTPIGKNDEDADTLFRQLKGKPINGNSTLNRELFAHYF